MWKNLLHIGVTLVMTACGEFIPGEGNNDLTAVSERPSVNAGGLVIRIKNALMQNKPDISVVVCAEKRQQEVTESDKHPPKRENLCYGSHATVKFDAQVIYHLSKTLTDKLLEHAKNGGEISVKFNDSHSRSLSHWHCWHHPSVDVKSNTNLTQYVDITITQSNLLSYSCLVGSF